MLAGNPKSLVVVVVTVGCAGSRPEPGKGQQMDLRAVQSRNLDMGHLDCEGEMRSRLAPLLGASPVTERD